MRKTVVFMVVAALMVAMVSGAALAKGKPAGKPGKVKKNPIVTYVFKGEIASVDETNGSAAVDVKKGNKFARSYAGQQVDFAVNGATRIVEDDVETTLSNLDVGDRALVQVRAPKSGAVSFTANKVVAESPVAYYFDADGDGIGAGEAEYYFSGEEPEDYVSEDGDNCADVANPDQADADGNGIGDACEPVV